MKRQVHRTPGCLFPPPPIHSGQLFAGRMILQRVAVIGAGTMGNGIAQAAALSGLDVRLIDVSAELVERGLRTISGNLQRGVDKGKMTLPEKEAVLGRIKSGAAVAEVGDADIVIEAIVENVEAKTRLFSQLDSITNAQTILATNTSSISITKI